MQFLVMFLYKKNLPLVMCINESCYDKSTDVNLVVFSKATIHVMN